MTEPELLARLASDLANALGMDERGVLDRLLLTIHVYAREYAEGYARELLRPTSYDEELLLVRGALDDVRSRPHA